MTTIHTRQLSGLALAFYLNIGPDVQAQQLTALDVLAPIGASYDQLGIIGNIPFDTLVGNDVVWEYDWIEVDPTAADITTQVIPLADAPDADLYPGADRVERVISGPTNETVTDRFYDVVEGAISELGSVGPVLSYVYDDPRLVLDLPLQFQDTVRDEYCFWSDGLGTQYHFCGHSYVTFDQVGTLILPGGTYPSAKHVTFWRSSLETTEPATDSSYTIQQQWYVEGTPFPVLDVSLFISSESGLVYASGRVLREAAFTNIKEQGVPTLSVFPNPASNEVIVRRTTPEGSLLQIQTTDGRLLYAERIPAQSLEHRVALDHFPNALYVVQMISPTTTMTCLFQKVD